MMWLSKQLRQSAAEEEHAAADLGVTTIGGARTGVYTRGETREVELCAPGGLVWRPQNGDRVVVLKGGPGGEEAFVLGKQSEAECALADGEIGLQVDGASVVLKRGGIVQISGTVCINGTLLINGEPYKPCPGGTENEDETEVGDA